MIPSDPPPPKYAIQSSVPSTGVRNFESNFCNHILQHGHDLVVAITNVAEILYVSPSWAGGLGVCTEAALSQPLATFLTEDEIATQLQLFERVIAGRATIEGYEHRYKRQDGTWQWVQSNCSPHFDAQGNLDCLVIISRDISRQKELEEELRQATAFFNSVVNALPDPIFIKDENHRMLSVNKAHCDMMGMTIEQLLDPNVDALIPREELEVFWEQDDKALASEHPVENEEKITDIQGGTRIVLTKKVAHHLPDGKKVLIGTVRDISERKAAEDALHKAKAAAESANHTKSTFLSTMTHELRTPMNAMLGMTNLLLDTTLTDEQLDLVDGIRSSADALLTLINGILDFSKIEANRLELEAHDFDLTVCIEEALDLVASQATVKGLTLAYFIEKDVPNRLRQDSTRIRQILANLLSNAIKFTARGDITVSADIQRKTDAHCQLHIAVKDSGIGIPADRMDRLFQSFSQVDSSTARHYGGTGLGLAISKRLAELMGGTMWVESMQGEGSTFHFTVQADELTSSAPLYETDISNLRNRRVLIATENEIIRRSLIQHLDRWEMETFNVSADNLNLLATRFPSTDVLIIDSKLRTPSVVSALEEFEHLRATLPTIVLISLGEAVQKQPTRVSIAKPVHVSHLYDALTNIFEGKTSYRRRAPKVVIDHEMARRHPLKILLAEDNAVNQKVALAILAKHGYRADVAANGLEVLEAVSRHHYDVILMDINMPEMDGLAATRAIRVHMPNLVQPYIIALTANAMLDDYKQCVAVGMNDYLSKPIQVAQLMEALLNAPIAQTQSALQPVH